MVNHALMSHCTYKVSDSAAVGRSTVRPRDGWLLLLLSQCLKVTTSCDLQGGGET